MSDDVRAKAFEPFFTTKTMGKGTGLGLATVFGLVEQNNGSIEIDSAPGKGTSIRILLQASDKQAEDRAVSAPAPGPDPTRAGRILIVDDEPGVRMFLRSALDRLDYTIIEASDGSEALRLAEGDDRVDILVTDVVMPGMTGPHLAARLTERFPGIKTIFMSGYDRGHAISADGVNSDAAFLQKPFTVQTLLDALDASLERASVEAS